MGHRLMVLTKDDFDHLEKVFLALGWTPPPKKEEPVHIACGAATCEDGK